MKRIVIVGATSGIGLEVATLCIREGWRVGAAGRREEALEALRATAPEQVETEPLDITRDDAPGQLARLIDTSLSATRTWVLWLPSEDTRL